ncbi:MAG: hypothetical protein HDQ88_04670 [Clostridia bacterium]|nr:hypothetical protein [Clostridia bacterium]
MSSNFYTIDRQNNKLKIKTNINDTNNQKVGNFNIVGSKKIITNIIQNRYDDLFAIGNLNITNTNNIGRKEYPYTDSDFQNVKVFKNDILLDIDWTQVVRKLGLYINPSYLSNPIKPEDPLICHMVYDGFNRSVLDKCKNTEGYYEFIFSFSCTGGVTSFKLNENKDNADVYINNGGGSLTAIITSFDISDDFKIDIDVTTEDNRVFRYIAELKNMK